MRFLEDLFEIALPMPFPFLGLIGKILSSSNFRFQIRQGIGQLAASGPNRFPSAFNRCEMFGFHRREQDVQRRDCLQTQAEPLRDFLLSPGRLWLDAEQPCVYDGRQRLGWGTLRATLCCSDFNWEVT